MSGGQMVFAGAGSRAVRNAIEKHQPMLGLHGHIHEAQGVITDWAARHASTPAANTEKGSCVVAW